nr:chemotaxis protein CheB [Acetobacter fallax]
MPEGVSAVRILLVDDDPAVRKTLVDGINAIAGASICGEASDSEDAFDLLVRARPDLIVMRADLPGMSGLQVTRSVMVRQPTPIIVTADLATPDPEIAFESLRSGALALIPRPASAAAGRDLAARIVACARLAGASASNLVEIPDAPGVPVAPRLITLVAGDGALGPAMRLFDDLPRLTAPLLLATSIDSAFFPAFVSWLSDLIPQGAIAAIQSNGGPLSSGPVHVLPAGTIATITPEAGVSVITGLSGPGNISTFDLLLTTMAETLGAASAAVLFGHIGTGGASGLLALQKTGSRTLAEFPAACPFAQAPGLARRIGAAEFCGSASELAAYLRDLVTPPDTSPPAAGPMS